jgi:predicted Zn-dependent protease|tara:strand:- start:2417 stop:2773 length:357 start_codon:yes stop_codon:yes gene_type:complete
MSIRSLCESLGQTIQIHSPVTSVDSVNTEKYTYSLSKTVKGYVSDNGMFIENQYDRLEGSQNVTIYIPGNQTIEEDYRLIIGDDLYQITNIRHPGRRTSGPLAYTIVEAQTDTAAATE